MESLRGKLQLLASHVFVLRSPVQLGPRPLTWGFFEQNLSELRDNFPCDVLEDARSTEAQT